MALDLQSVRSLPCCVFSLHGLAVYESKAFFDVHQYKSLAHPRAKTTTASPSRLETWMRQETAGLRPVNIVPPVGRVYALASGGF